MGEGDAASYNKTNYAAYERDLYKIRVPMAGSGEMTSEAEMKLLKTLTVYIR